MGEGLATATRQRISTLVQQDHAVKKIKHILSTYQSPEEVLLILIIIFKEGLDTNEINDAVLRIRATVKREFSFVHFILIQPEALEK